MDCPGCAGSHQLHETGFSDGQFSNSCIRSLEQGAKLPRTAQNSCFGHCEGFPGKATACVHQSSCRQVHSFCSSRLYKKTWSAPLPPTCQNWVPTGRPSDRGSSVRSRSGLGSTGSGLWHLVMSDTLSSWDLKPPGHPAMRPPWRSPVTFVHGAPSLCLEDCPLPSSQRVSVSCGPSNDST